MPDSDERDRRLLATLAYRVDRLEQDMQAKHERTNENHNRIERTVIAHDRTLVELVGQRGADGRLGQLAIAVERLDVELASFRRLGTKVLLAAVGGAGGVMGLIEAIRALLE